MSIDEIRNTYRGRRVVVTGHTGFKGSWLTAWLSALGAEVTGIALDPDQGEDNLFDRAKLAELCAADHRFDISDEQAVSDVFAMAKPEIVFHLAAQAIVRDGYERPVETFRTNVLGTAHVLEAARQTPSVLSIVCVTTDKVYENNEWCWPYRENDQLGGIDPYSASKAGAELVARAYMETLRAADGRTYNLATARGGNVVGGGDWSKDRIVPDIVRAVKAGNPLVLRSPGAIRPWQHVVELCYGYLLLGHRLLRGWTDRGRLAADFAGAWNFGPDPRNEITVSDLVAEMQQVWKLSDLAVEHRASTLHESTYLRLDCSKARAQLGWQGLLGPSETLAWTAKWYQGYLDDPAAARTLTLAQVGEFEGRVAQAETA